MKLASLAGAIQQHVLPGMFLHFGSTPSRCNAGIVELVRQFRGKSPGFTFSATGFHSTAHLLSSYRLGRRLIGCFYGDNYPQPRPNALYQALHEEGTVLEHWSLLNYVLALRAAALGHPGALTRSLASTSLGYELTRHGRYVELELPDDLEPTQRECGLLFPLVPDLSFLHAPVADAAGHAWFWPPHSEAFHGALAARKGVILSADRILSREQVLAHPELIPIPSHRVLAVCEAPFGAHPQPVHCGADDDRFSYRDDFEAYLWWRRVTSDRELLADFESRVLDAEDSWSAYRSYVGPAQLDALRTSAKPVPSKRPTVEPTRAAVELGDSERMVVLAARYLAGRIEASRAAPAGDEPRLDCMLAGIGQSFAAARLCKLLLGEAGRDFELMVETGFAGFGEPGELGDSYLLSQRNIALSTRLSNVESVLGTWVAGAQNHCIGVIGGAEVDALGNVNSTWSNGKLLVGSGGACDIALGAREVVVLARADRLVCRVEYITSPGARVRAVVTEHGVLERTSDGWQLLELGPALPSSRAAQLRAEFLTTVPWPNLVAPLAREASADAAASALPRAELSTGELAFVQALRAEALSTTPAHAAAAHTAAAPISRTEGERWSPSH